MYLNTIFVTILRRFWDGKRNRDFKDWVKFKISGVNLFLTGYGMTQQHRLMLPEISPVGGNSTLQQT